MPQIVGSTVATNGIFARDFLDEYRNVIKEFTLIYQVQADDALQDEDDIRNTPGLPEIGDRLRGAWCVARNFREENTHAGLWEAVCEFSSKPYLVNEQAVRWRWDFETEEQVVENDPVTLRPIVNSSEEQILTTAPVAIPVLTIERIQASFSPEIIQLFQNKTNLSTFWGAPRNCALMSGIRDEEYTIDQTPLRKVSYIIKFKFKQAPPNNGGKPEVTVINNPPQFTLADGEYIRFTSKEIGWKINPLDIGTRWFRDVTGQRGWVTFKDAEGNPTTGLLDGFGQPCPDWPASGGPGENNTRTVSEKKPVHLEYHRFGEAEFNDLNLGPYA